MKRIILLVVLAALCGGIFVFAQEAESEPAREQKFKNESEYYYFNVPIEKIYAYRAGYVVIYRKGANRMARTYVPVEWFTTIGGKAEFIGLGSGSEWPSMTVYYKNGEFSHARFRVRRSRAHETWGVVPLNVNLDEYFEGIEELQLEF